MENYFGMFIWSLLGTFGNSRNIDETDANGAEFSDEIISIDNFEYDN